MSDVKELCDLCGVVIKLPEFTLKTTIGEKLFCCEGCKAIYQLLNEKLSEVPSDL